jgi:hypothetical protein
MGGGFVHISIGVPDSRWKTTIFWGAKVLASLFDVALPNVQRTLHHESVF